MVFGLVMLALRRHRLVIWLEYFAVVYCSEEGFSDQYAEYEV